jgi:hypothetical protein
MNKECLQELDLKFTSGNSIPVERATMLKSEYDQLKKYIVELEKKAEMFDETIDLLKDIYCNYECGKKIDDQIRPFLERAKKIQEDEE